MATARKYITLVSNGIKNVLSSFGNGPFGQTPFGH